MVVMCLSTKFDDMQRLEIRPSHALFRGSRPSETVKPKRSTVRDSLPIQQAFLIDATGLFPIGKNYFFLIIYYEENENLSTVILVYCFN